MAADTAAPPGDDYVLLVEGGPPPAARAEPATFSVDDAMRARRGIEGYQQRVWDQLPDGFRRAMVKDGMVTRVAGWDATRRELLLQPARYASQMVTNHVDAQAVEVDGRRVGALGHDAAGAWESFERSPLANTLGVAAMVRTRDERWVVAVRSARMAYEPAKLGCSASGSVDWQDPATWEPDGARLWNRKILEECDEELGFVPAPSEIVFLAIAREALRLGKPQVFLLIESGRTRREVEEAFRTHGDGEHDALRFLDDAEAHALTARASHDGTPVTTELRMNLWLAQQARAARAGPR